MKLIPIKWNQEEHPRTSIDFFFSEDELAFCHNVCVFISKMSDSYFSNFDQ